MHINSLNLENFRSWKKYKIDFNDINILIGPNGVGKTNVLESIWLLADGRSWRTSHDVETIFWGEEFARISADITNSKKLKIELFLQKPKNSAFTNNQSKILKIDGIKHRLIDLLGEMPSVLFCPESINMVGGAPNLRRKFLDILLSQINRSYTLSLVEYFKILKERNSLLEAIKLGKSQSNELDFWDEKLSENGIIIINYRKKAINFFNKNISQIYQELSGSAEKMRIVYRESISSDNFLEHLIGSREREISQGATIGGPHRDDWIIYLNDKDLSTFGSRGEYRSAVLSLKILELRYLEEEKRDPSTPLGASKPILLLDDIFSELDKDRRDHLAKIVSNQQTIITTTDLDHIQKDLRERAKIIKL